MSWRHDPTAASNSGSPDPRTSEASPTRLATTPTGDSPSRWSKIILGRLGIGHLDALLTQERVRNYPVIVLVVLLLLYGYTSLTTSGTIPLPDYTSRWTAGRMVLDGQAHLLYDSAAQFAVQQSLLGATRLTWFVSPPYVAALFAPLGALPYATSCIAWTCISLAALWGSFRLLRPYAPPVLMRNKVTTGLVLSASYIVFNLVAGGQDTALVVLAVAASMRLLDEGKEVEAGAVLAFGLIKPHLILLLPLVFAVHRRPRALLSFVAVGAMLLGLSALLVGTTGIHDWLKALSSPLYADKVIQGQAWLSAGLPAFLSELLPPANALAWQPALTAVGVGLGAVTIGLLLRRPPEVTQTWGILILATALASPHYMVYDLVLTFVALPPLALAAWSPRTRVALALTYVALWLVPMLHVLATRLSWPATIIQTPWPVVGIAFAWLSLLRKSRPPDRCHPRNAAV